MVITDETILPPHMERQRQMMKEMAANRKKVVTPEPEEQPRKHKLSGKMRERWLLFNRLVDVEQRNLTDSEFRVLITLFRDMRRGVARTAQSDLARRTGKRRETICRSLKSLVAKGLVDVLHQGGLIGSEGQRETSQYRVSNRPAE